MSHSFFLPGVHRRQTQKRAVRALKVECKALQSTREPGGSGAKAETSRGKGGQPGEQGRESVPEGGPHVTWRQERPEFGRLQGRQAWIKFQFSGTSLGLFPYLAG